jgi:hypothetical protein
MRKHPQEHTKASNVIQGGKTKSNLFALDTGEFDFIFKFWEAGSSSRGPGLNRFCWSFRAILPGV